MIIAQNEMELYNKIVKGVFPLPDHLTSEAKALLKRILKSDTKDRPNPDEVYYYLKYLN